MSRWNKIIAVTCNGFFFRVSWLRQIIEDNMQLHVLEQHMVRLIANHALLEDVYHVVEAKLSRPKVSSYSYTFGVKRGLKAKPMGISKVRSIAQD